MITKAERNLDESTARRQMKPPRSLSGRSTPFVQCQSALPFWDTAISKFDHENPWSRSCVWSKVKVTCDLQNSKVKVMVKVKPIGHIWGLRYRLRYRKFHIWPWNSRPRSWPRSNLMVNFEALEFNWYVCFSFCGNRTILGWDMANSIFDLENSRSRSWPRSNLRITFEP